MQIHVNTAYTITDRDALVTDVEAVINSSLQYFESQITRVEVHLSDENGKKGGSDDKRCVLEARVERHQPIVASHQAETIKLAYSGAATKLKAAVTSALGKLSTY